jgi:glycosyltransferase involved in cell wall biosynthesis
MDPGLSAPARFAYLSVERILAGLCARIICVSPAERDHLQSLGFPEQKLRVVCNGIDPLPETNRNAIRYKLNLDKETVCYGFVGRISHQKAVDRAISAFAKVSEQDSHTHLVIVGDGPDLNAMKTLAADLGLSRQVTFTGAANGAELMAAFDVFLLPSRYEGLPYVLLEAAAKALPIVMTDVGGAHLIVRDGENGFILPQIQLGQLADRLLLLAKKPELRSAMAMKSAEIAASFSLDNMVDGTLAVYRELVSG